MRIEKRERARSATAILNPQFSILNSKTRVLLLCALFVVSPVHAGVSYEVSAVAETETVTFAHPAAGDRQLHQPPPRDVWGRERPRPPVSRAPRRSKTRPMRLTASVRIDGQNIRIDNYDLDDGRRRSSKRTREIFISRDGGVSFTLIDLDRGTIRPWPLELSFNPAVMGLRAFGGILGGAEAEAVRVERERMVAEPVGSFDTRRTRVRARFEVPADERLRRQRMKVKSTMDVWTTSEIPARVPAGLHGWGTGFAGADAVVRERVQDVDGFPVKVVTKLVIDSGRNQQTTTTSVEVSNVVVERLDPTIFDVSP